MVDDQFLHRVGGEVVGDGHRHRFTEGQGGVDEAAQHHPFAPEPAAEIERGGALHQPAQVTPQPLRGQLGRGQGRQRRVGELGDGRVEADLTGFVCRAGQRPGYAGQLRQVVGSVRLAHRCSGTSSSTVYRSSPSR